MAQLSLSPAAAQSASGTLAGRVSACAAQEPSLKRPTNSKDLRPWDLTKQNLPESFKKEELGKASFIVVTEEQFTQIKEPLPPCIKVVVVKSNDERDCWISDGRGKFMKYYNFAVLSDFSEPLFGEESLLKALNSWLQSEHDPTQESRPLAIRRIWLATVQEMWCWIFQIFI